MDRTNSFPCSFLFWSRRRVVVATPDFSMYQFYTELHGAKAEVYSKTEDFKVTSTI